jgi:site-specific DNA-cytosine methylase
MSRLRVLDLFSGIGGFSLGLERTGGFETVAFCEINPFAQRVLAKHWPEVPCYDDVRMLSGELHETAFRRYCAENKMIFAGPEGVAIKPTTDGEVRLGEAKQTTEPKDLAIDHAAGQG